MKNLILIILTSLTVSYFCSSCSDSDKEHKFVEMTELDFGEGTYRPNPFKFLDSVPPFSWMGMPDSVKRETELEITFNEDAIRSLSSGQLAFVDQNRNKVNGIEFGNKVSDIITVDAKDGTAVMPVRFTVNPEVGDSVLRGSLLVIGNDLDQVNETKLSSMATPIASWSLTHKTGINWWRWMLLIVCVAIALYILYLLGCLIYGAIVTVIASLSDISFPSFKFNNKRANKIEHEKVEKRKDNRNRNPFIVRCERLLLSPYTSLSDKGTTLESLFIFWDYQLPESDKEFEAKMLDPRVLNAMNYLWERNRFYKYTKKGMTWSGETLNSILVPDPNVVPRNKNYSNVDNLSWKDIMMKYNYNGLVYRNGKPDFSKLAWHTIQISNFDSFVDPNDDTERGPLQEEAFNILAETLNKPISEIRTYKEQNRLVWHEDTDCRTLFLVPQEIHNNLDHFGGIGMLKALRKCGLF